MTWPQRCLGDVMEFRNGLSYSAADRGNGLPIVGVADVSVGGQLPSRGFTAIRRPSNLPEAALLKTGDLLFVRSNGSRALVGRCAEVGPLDEPTSHSGFTIRARVIAPDVNPKWVAAFFMCGLGDAALGRGSRGTNINNLRQERLQGIEIPCPKRDIQDRFISTFSMLDEQIRLTERLRTLHIRQRKGLCDSLLTGAMDTTQAENEHPKSHAFQARPPDGWRVFRLDAVADIACSNVDKKTIAHERPVRLCNYMDVWLNDYVEDSMPFMAGSATAEECSRFQLRPGDVLLTKDSETKEDIASTAVVVSAGEDLVLGYHLALVRPRSNLAVGSFLAKQLMLPPFRKHFVRSATGATRFGLTLDSIRSASVWLPEVTQQLRIADVLEKSDRVIQALTQRVQLLTGLRKAAVKQAFMHGSRSGSARMTDNGDLGNV